MTTSPDRLSTEPGTEDATPHACAGCVAADGSTPAGSNRRELFRRASLVALAGGGVAALAACGGTDSSAGPAGGSSGSPAAGPSSAASSPSASDSPSAPSSASGSASGSASSQPTGTEFAKTEVPVGGGVIKDKLVVTQPTSGTYKAFSGICTHQGCPVSAVQDGIILCRCHGSEFSIEDGSVKRGPANQPLAAKNVEQSGSNLFVS